MNIPPLIQSGDSTVWVDKAQTLNGIYYDAVSYGLLYCLRGASTLDLTATASGANWQTAITTTQSAALLPGTYQWSAYLTATGQRITAGQGSLSITANLQTLAAGQSALSFYEQALSDTEQALAAYSKSGGQPIEWQIGPNRYKFNTLQEILRIANYFRACVASEKTSSQIAQGQGNPRKLYVRFGR